MPSRGFTEKEQQDIIRRFKRGDTIGLISFALGRDKKRISQILRDAGLDTLSRRRLRTTSVAWAWRGKQ